MLPTTPNQHRSHASLTLHERTSTPFRRRLAEIADGTERLRVADVPRPADHGVRLTRWSSQQHRPPTVFFPKSLQPLPEEGACTGGTEPQASGLVAGCSPPRRTARLPVRLLGDRAVQEVVALQREIRCEYAQERTQLQTSMCVAILLDGKCDTEPASTLRTPERRNSFRKSAGTRVQVHDGHAPRHGMLPIGERS